MNELERFGELRALAQAAPGEQAWGALCEELERWSGEALEQVALPYVAAHLEGWPDALRERAAWCERLEAGEDEPRAALLRVIKSRAEGAALDRLLGAPMLDRRRRHHLRVSGRSFTAASLDALCEGGGLAALERFDVSGCSLAGASALARLGALRSLDAHDCDLDVMSALALAESGASLRYAWIAWCPLGDDGVEALAGSPLLWDCDSVCVEQVGLTAWMMPALLGALGPTLYTLRLERNALCEEGALEIAQASQLAGLRQLELLGCDLGDHGVRALADTPHLSALRTLDLRMNQLTDAALIALAASPHLGALEELWVSDPGISERGMQAIASSPRLSDSLRRRFGGLS